MSGSVNIVSEEGVFTKLVENQVFGEKALSTETIRDTSATALETSYCLSICRFDFTDKTFFFEYNQKAKRMIYLQSLSFTEDWTIEKMTHLNTELG